MPRLLVASSSQLGQFARLKLMACISLCGFVALQSCSVDLLESTPGASTTPAAPLNVSLVTEAELDHFFATTASHIQTHCSKCHIEGANKFRFEYPASGFDRRDSTTEEMAKRNIVRLLSKELSLRRHPENNKDDLRKWLPGHGADITSTWKSEDLWLQDLAGCDKGTGAFVDEQHIREPLIYYRVAVACQKQ